MIFYGKRYSRYFKYEQDMQYLSEYPLTFPSLKLLQAIYPIIRDHHQTIKQ